MQEDFILTVECEIETVSAELRSLSLEVVWDNN